MRDYANLDAYYSELLGDVYAQPLDEEHIQNTKLIVNWWLAPLKVRSVLDVGCGEGIAEEEFKRILPEINYTGMALGKDVRVAQEAGRNVIESDFNFLAGCPDNYYELLLARHALEHSPFPVLTLMEWHRVSKEWLAVVLPNPRHYTFVGRNHYSVMDSHQAAWLMRRAGWKLKKFYMNEKEIWFLCKKHPRISYEGWAEVPLSSDLHRIEKEKLKVEGQVVLF